MESEWQQRALTELLNVVGNLSKKNELIENNYKWAMESTWKARGEEFIKQYLEGGQGLREGLGQDQTQGQAQDQAQSQTQGQGQVNHANMYNWVQDLPSGQGHKARFLEALAIAKPTRILEIGTFAGTSLIEMLHLYPNASGVAIDAWKNYNEDNINILRTIEETNIEQVFYENIKNAGLAHRVTSLKGDSVDRLTELIRGGKTFDFIYVDGSHACLDCYGDMILAWKLLCKGGVLAVDDVLYNYDRVLAGDHLSYPFMAKKHFMEKFAGQFRTISDSYRLFIQKL